MNILFLADRGPGQQLASCSHRRWGVRHAAAPVRQTHQLGPGGQTCNKQHERNQKQLHYDQNIVKERFEPSHKISDDTDQLCRALALMK